MYWIARQTISSSNVIGAQAVKIYNIMKDVAGLKHMEENIVIRNFDAIKKTIITGNTQYVNEVNRYTENEVVNYRNKLLSDKGIIPPGSSQIPQKAKKITNEVVEVGTKEAIAKAWIKK